MKHIVLLVGICLFSLTGICKTKPVVELYTMPFMNSYYFGITKELIREHKDATRRTISGKAFYKELMLFLSNVDTCTVATEFMDIDVRVCLDVFKDRKSLPASIYLNRAGHFLYNDKVYEPNEGLLKIIRKYTNVTWPSR
jgi:hypothetical protein